MLIHVVGVATSFKQTNHPFHVQICLQDFNTRMLLFLKTKKKYCLTEKKMESKLFPLTYNLIPDGSKIYTRA